MATDLFTDTDGTALTTHDSAWTHSSGDTTGTIYDNCAGLSGIYQKAFYRYSGSNVDRSIVRLKANGPESFGLAGPMIRASATNPQGYYMYLSKEDGVWRGGAIRRAGAGWESLYGYVNHSVSEEHDLELRINGTNVEAWINGSLIHSVEDTSMLVSGESGFFVETTSTSQIGYALSWSDGASAAAALPRRALDGSFYGSLRGSVR